MSKMFSAVQPIYKLLSVKHFTTSDIFFQINTKFTVVLLILFSVLLTTWDLLRTSIDCYTDNHELKKTIMDNYCWTMGTFICKGQTNVHSTCAGDNEENKIYQKYYQWIPLALSVQAALSYIPALIWKMAEGGRLKKLCQQLDTSFNRENWNAKKNLIVAYFNDHSVRRAHMRYVNMFLVCKLFSIVFILINIYMIESMIPGFWGTYSQASTALLTGNSGDWTTSSSLIFPRIAKCMYYSTGASGSLQRFDSLCLLPQNVLNQKLFVILWLWFITQGILSICNLVYWMIIGYSTSLRVEILRHHSMRSLPRKKILQASNRGHIGNFFVLKQVARNTSETTFIELLNELALNASNSTELKPLDVSDNLFAEKSNKIV